MIDPELAAAVITSWAEFLVRWTHVITAIAWIGSSFYFIALDLGLRRDPPPPSGADGEEWQVHGGGFYHIEKYLVAPPHLPERLTWFKWESYATWLSGLALMALVYWHGAELNLIDPARADLARWQAVAISAGSLALGWLVYDRLCRSGLAERQTLLMGLIFVMLLVMGWGYERLFTGRAVMLHLGAFTATIMTANVFFVIIPGQRKVVAALRAGEAPDPALGRAGKLRSTHNNYLTLPVVFLMLSNHYPLAFAGRWNWLIAGLVFLIGVLIRHFFNTMHARRGRPWWCWAAAAALMVAIVWLSLAGSRAADAATAEARATTAEVVEIVQMRCAMCHAREPLWPGLAAPPRGVVLETAAEVTRRAGQIRLWAGLTRAMPPANVSAMEEAERDRLLAWRP